MAPREHFLARLLELPRIQDRAVRRGVFRQAVAELGQADSSAGPMALAGVDPRALGRSTQMLVADGLLDDLDFIAPAAAAVALYQIAGALPLGDERRQIGRRVLAYLYKGNADTFASLASRMAMGSVRPLAGAGVRARVMLSMCLRSSCEAAVDRLALAIVARRELANSWVHVAATGSLPDRRQAGRLLERAAREAARRAELGDFHPLRVFETVCGGEHLGSAPRPDSFGSLGPAWQALLADRETLVWRHVAIARGLLCAVLPEFVEETRRALTPDLTPTEWRRGATSLASRIAVDRERALSEAMALLDSPLLRRDSGIAQALVWGLTPAAEIEPEAAEELLDAIVAISPISIADSLVDLRTEVPGFGSQAAERCVAALRSSMVQPPKDDGLRGLAQDIVDDLESGGESRELLQAVRRGLEAFGAAGTREAHGLARQALAVASEKVGQLEALDVVYHDAGGASQIRREAMKQLREIDSALLESRLLHNLLLLGRAPGTEATGVESIDDLDARLAHWLLDGRRRSATQAQIKAQTTIHQRQLRALLHLIDGGCTDFGDAHDRRLRVRARWTSAVRCWVAYVHEQPKSRLTRAVVATIARAFDALVRDSAAEPVDIFLYTASHLSAEPLIAIVAEASMHPDVVQIVAHYLSFVRAELAAGGGADQVQLRLNAFQHFLEAFPSHTTIRSEAFRTTAWALVRALQNAMAAGSLRALVPLQNTAAGAGPLAGIEDCLAQLGQLVIGAARRCSEEVVQQPLMLTRRQALAHAIENAVNTDTMDELLEAIGVATRAAGASLPAPIARLVTATLPRLTAMQADRPSLPPSVLQPQHTALPDWLPARRIIGGFYVIKQLSGGNVGTVFEVTRAEDRHDHTAPRFALKVPEYNATAARTMSETEFLKLFREEAGALLSVPDHPNIARFVTFDAGAKPKPLLVMELIEGVSCERLIYSTSLDAAQAAKIIEGVATGLEVMHERGVAHLDVKPSNIILRQQTEESVLVDFGLAGRHLRPGCATLLYGAPEIWETAPDVATSSPASAADVYAVGCFAFEVMVGRALFDGSSETAIITAHISHDGLPSPIDKLAQNATLQPFAMFLYQCLRHDPLKRADMTAVRNGWRTIAPSLAALPWPLRLG